MPVVPLKNYHKGYLADPNGLRDTPLVPKGTVADIYVSLWSPTNYPSDQARFRHPSDQGPFEHAVYGGPLKIFICVYIRHRALGHQWSVSKAVGVCQVAFIVVL